MARVYPRYLLSDGELAEQGLPSISAAERRLFDLFKDHLDDDYAIFHGVEFQAHRDRGDGISDLEVDFVITHPEHGVLTLEVKGGLIRIEGAAGKWVSRDRHGKTHSIKNPFTQAKVACYQLFEVLREHEALRQHDYSTWYAIALPDVDVTDDLAPAIRREIVIDRRDAHPAHIQEAVERVFSHYRRHGQKGPGEKGLRAFKRALAPDWFLRTHLATDFEHEQEQFKELTEQQYDLLAFIDHHERAMIAGCAGSGKTMLALEKARRLADQDLKVLFTCYNRSLAEWLAENFPHEGITFQHFHSLAMEVPKQAGEPVPWHTDLEGVDPGEYWSTYVPEKLFEAAAALPREQRYDAVIVDEGQDFKSTYWEAVQMMLKEPDEGILYIFYDDSQRLYSDDDFPLPKATGYLNKNLRSTQEIGEVIARYHTGARKLIPSGPESGRAVDVVDVDRYENEADALTDVLGMLADEGVPSDDIVVLTPVNKDSQWEHRMQLGDFELIRKDLKQKSTRIRVETIHSFKGLEKSVVILTELDKLEPEEEDDELSEEEWAIERDRLLYVALSRAKHHVIVIGDLPEPTAT